VFKRDGTLPAKEDEPQNARGGAEKRGRKRVLVVVRIRGNAF